MLVSFPVAFWSGALITDGIGAATRDPFWYHMSVVLIAMGSIGAVLAGIFGYIDFVTTPMSREAKRCGTNHFLWSLGTMVVFPVAWLARVYDHASAPGIALTILGSLLLLVGGYYGSELANRYRVGILEVLAPAPGGTPARKRDGPAVR
jgi:uncharacterized membrane protein